MTASPSERRERWHPTDTSDERRGAVRKTVTPLVFVPVHDRPTVIEHGRVLRRLYARTPREIIDNDTFPRPLTEAFEAAKLAVA